MTGIINYGAGNIYSLQCALDRVGAKYALVGDADSFHTFDQYIIPGVGHARPAMEQLKHTGLVPLIKNTKKPVLGVCLGMQLLTEYSEEGNTDLLGLVPLQTKRFISDKFKIPQMGWNTISLSGILKEKNVLFKGIEEDTFFYFVHSYFVEFNFEFTACSSNYGTKFSAAICKDNFYGVQFHPEKSGLAGEQVLKNFIGIQ